MNPHSTQKSGRTCESCHVDTRAVGLGRGSVKYINGDLKFIPALSSSPDITGLDHPLDAFVDIDGRPLVHTSRPGLRTFNREEIKRILYVGLCLECHRDFNDKVMENWNPSNPPEPCVNMNYR